MPLRAEMALKANHRASRRVPRSLHRPNKQLSLMQTWLAVPAVLADKLVPSRLDKVTGDKANIKPITVVECKLVQSDHESQNMQL